VFCVFWVLCLAAILILPHATAAAAAAATALEMR
jgi:hypothetical protein